MTNRDVMREMSNDELSVFIYTMLVRDMCTRYNIKGILKWLNEEVTLDTKEAIKLQELEDFWYDK